jgi:hypothetical protein
MTLRMMATAGWQSSAPVALVLGSGVVVDGAGRSLHRPLLTRVTALAERETSATMTRELASEGGRRAAGVVYPPLGAASTTTTGPDAR